MALDSGTRFVGYKYMVAKLAFKHLYRIIVAIFLTALPISVFSQDFSSASVITDQNLAAIYSNILIIRSSPQNGFLDKFNPVTRYTTSASGFVTNIRGAKYLLTAAHATESINRSGKISLFAPTSYGSKLMGEIIQDRYIEDRMSPFSRVKAQGIDFAAFDLRKLSRSVFSSAKIPQGLPLRNLLDHPLRQGERISFAGFRDDKFKKFDCNYIGISKDVFEMHGYSFQASCNNTDYNLDGLSGGVFFDAEGMVIGIFTGYLGTGSQFILGTPIFSLIKNEKLQLSGNPLSAVLLSVSKISSPCFDSFGRKSDRACVLEADRDGTFKFSLE